MLDWWPWGSTMNPSLNVSKEKREQLVESGKNFTPVNETRLSNTESEFDNLEVNSIKKTKTK